MKPSKPQKDNPGMNAVLLVVLFLIIVPVVLFVAVRFVHPGTGATSAEPAASGSGETVKNAPEEHRVRHTGSRSARQEAEAVRTSDVPPDPESVADPEPVADPKPFDSAIGAINPHGRGKQAMPYRPDEVPGDSGVVVQYAGSPDDMAGAPLPPPQEDLWGGRTPTPIPPANMRGIGGVRRVDPDDPFFRQDIPNPFGNR